MNHPELLQVFDETVAKMRAIMVEKNKDYAVDGDAFSNFRLVERLGIVSTEKGIAVRMCDKMARVSNLLGREASVKGESVGDTLLDLANYCILNYAYLDDKSHSLGG